MSITDSFRELAGVLEALEAEGIEVADVSAREGELLADGSVSVRLSVTAPLFDAIDAEGVEITPERVDLGEDGSVTAALSVAVPVDEGGADAPEPADDGSAEGSTNEPAETPEGDPDETPSDGSVGTADDGSAEPGDGDSADAPSEGPAEATADDTGEGTPPHRDPEKLRDAYREHGTFAEMTEALGADVTPQTVRRNMIEHGIHEPGSGGGTDGEPDDGGEIEEGVPAERADADGESGTDEADASTPLADGVDLPDGVALDDIKEAVVGSRTLHEVQGRLGVDRERARRLLRELDLLDLVASRLSEGGDEVSMEEIERRIRRAAPTSA